MLLPQPAGAFRPVSFDEAAEAKDKQFGSQEEAYNRDKWELRMLAPDEKVRVQSEKNSYWDKIGTALEVRPDKQSYLLDIEGKLMTRARFMIRPLEVGVSLLAVSRGHASPAPFPPVYPHCPGLRNGTAGISGDGISGISSPTD